MIKPILREVLLKLIEWQGVTRFYVGNQGNFDGMARCLLAELEHSYGIGYEVVLAYMPKKEDGVFDAGHTILPEGIETAPQRFAIDRRNRWMIDHSDIVLSYTVRDRGGAYEAKKYAEKLKKHIIIL